MQLGIILTPYGQIPGAYPSEIAYSYGGDGTYLCPEDPYYNTRGEIGHYYDTQLGGLGAGAMEYVTKPVLLPPPPTKRPGIFERMRTNRAIAKALQGGGLGRSVPSDFEIAPYYTWVPQIDGWVTAKEGFNPGTWIPPNGWNPAGAYGPPMTPPTYTYPGPLGGLRDTVQPTPADLIATLNDHNQKIFTLSIITTIAVATSAILSAWRTSKQLKHGA